MIESFLPILIIFLTFVIGAIPLHFAAKAFSAETTFLKSMIVNVLAGLIASVVAAFVPFFAEIIAFIAFLFVYKFAFRIGWIRSLAVWALQIVITVLLTLLVLLLGVCTVADLPLSSLF